MSERIAIVSTSYPKHAGDASGHFVETEAQQLAALGHHVTVITAGIPSGWCLAADGLCVVRLFDGGASGWPGLFARLRERPSRAFGLGVWCLRARLALEERGPFDRVVGHWLLPAGYPIITTARLEQSELEIVVHGSDARWIARWPWPMRRIFFEKLSRKGVRLRCVSNELAQLIDRAARGRFRGSIQVVPASLHVGPAKAKREARAELGMPAEQRIVVIAGRLIPEKRVDSALRAASLLADVEIFVIGDGGESESLRRRFPNARFLGRLSRPETLTYVSAADAVLSASRAEGSPSVVREARALGVPVVACDAGDLSLWAESDFALWVVR